jgi:pimeloyl-ACP methyl ester carboxylesterase
MKLIIALIISLAAFTFAAIGQTAAAKNPFPAAMETFQIPSHGVGLNALMYVAEGAAPHPVVILLHGFPGNERNLDLAQEMRRAGWNVLYFNYRGAWGTKGDFSFSHSIEDVASAVAYLKQPETVKKLRLDPSRIVLLGHSMGGFMTVQAAAADPTILAAGLISAAGAFAPEPVQADGGAAFIKRRSANLESQGMAPLAGCTPEGLARETFENSSKWAFSSKVESLRSRPVLIITSDDGLSPANDAFAAALTKAGNTRVTAAHFATDHSYSDKRLQLSAAVLKWLESLAAK